MFNIITNYAGCKPEVIQAKGQASQKITSFISNPN